MSRTSPSLLRRGDVTNVTPSEIDKVSASVDTKPNALRDARPTNRKVKREHA